MNKVIWAPALCLALGAAGVACADPPAAAGPDYGVTPDAGPWMICACYFSGPAAPDLAHQMVTQIRTRYNTPAYLFDFAEEERKKEQELLDQQRQALPFDAPPDGSDIVRQIPRRHPTIHVEEQCAVLIGGYADEDAAHKALLAVKKWGPPAINTPEGVLPFGSIIDHGKEHIINNPFTSMSMVVRNPTVPHDAAVDPIKDKFLITLNADEEFSMLQCPQKYTLAVKEYLGAAMVQQQGGLDGFLGAIGKGGDKSSERAGESLAVAANNAHELAKLLHKGGAEVYVLHTRTTSVVSIGSFDSPDDPRIKEVCAQYARWQQMVGGGQPDGAKKNPMGLFPNPVLVKAPHP